MSVVFIFALEVKLPMFILSFFGGYLSSVLNLSDFLAYWNRLKAVSEFGDFVILKL